MTHPSLQRNSYQPNNYYQDSLPTPATTSSRPIQPPQPVQNLPGAFPTTRNAYQHPETQSLPHYQLSSHQYPNTHSHGPSASQTSPQPAPYLPEMNGGTRVSGSRQDTKGVLKKEMYEYRAPWPVYGLDWSKRPGEKSFRLALGSFIEDYPNKVCIS